MMRFLKVSGFLLLILILGVLTTALLFLNMPFQAIYKDTLIIFPFLVNFALCICIASIPFFAFKNWLFFQGGRFLAYFSISGWVLVWSGLAYIFSPSHFSASLIFARNEGKVSTYLSKISEEKVDLSELSNSNLRYGEFDELCTAFSIDRNEEQRVTINRNGFDLYSPINYEVFSQYTTGDKKCSDASLAAGKDKHRKVQLEEYISKRRWIRELLVHKLVDKNEKNLLNFEKGIFHQPEVAKQFFAALASEENIYEVIDKLIQDSIFRVDKNNKWVFVTKASGAQAYVDPNVWGKDERFARVKIVFQDTVGFYLYKFNCPGNGRWEAPYNIEFQNKYSPSPHFYSEDSKPNYDNGSIAEIINKHVCSIDAAKLNNTELTSLDIQKMDDILSEVWSVYLEKYDRRRFSYSSELTGSSAEFFAIIWDNSDSAELGKYIKHPVECNNASVHALSKEIAKMDDLQQAVNSSILDKFGAAAWIFHRKSIIYGYKDAQSGLDIAIESGGLGKGPEKFKEKFPCAANVKTLISTYLTEEETLVR